MEQEFVLWDIERIPDVHIFDKYSAKFTYLLSSNSEKNFQESFVAFLGYSFNLFDLMSNIDIDVLINNHPIYRIIKRMISSVKFLHKNNVLHGNIAVQSFLLQPKGNSVKVGIRHGGEADIYYDYFVAISHFEYSTKFKSQRFKKSKRVQKSLERERKELGRIIGWMMNKTKADNPNNVLNQRTLIEIAVVKLIETGKLCHLEQLKSAIPLEVY